MTFYTTQLAGAIVGRSTKVAATPSSFEFLAPGCASMPHITIFASAVHVGVFFAGTMIHNNMSRTRTRTPEERVGERRASAPRCLVCVCGRGRVDASHKTNYACVCRA